MTLDNGLKPNGFKVRNWGDVLLIVGIGSVFVGLIGWGVRLEVHQAAIRKEILSIRVLLSEQAKIISEQEAIKKEIVEIRAVLSDQILPIAEERTKFNTSQIEDLRKRLDRAEDRLYRE